MPEIDNNQHPCPPPHARYTGSDRRIHCSYADEAADKAARKVIAEVFGVDTAHPEQLKNLRQSLMFTERLMKYAEKGALSMVATIVALLGAAVWASITFKFTGGK